MPDKEVAGMFLESSLSQSDSIEVGPTHGESPLQVVVMLYDGAIDSMRASRAEACRLDASRRVAHLERATGIVQSLMGCLDEKGGEMAETLSQLYTYVLTELSSCVATASETRVLRCERVMAELRDSWLSLEALVRPALKAA